MSPFRHIRILGSLGNLAISAQGLLGDLLKCQISADLAGFVEGDYVKSPPGPRRAAPGLICALHCSTVAPGRWVPLAFNGGPGTGVVDVVSLAYLSLKEAAVVQSFPRTSKNKGST